MFQNCLDEKVERIFLPNIDSTSIDAMLQLEKDYPNNFFPMMGLHPCSINEGYKDELALVKKWLDQRDFVAIGEIGIDLYWDKTFLQQQQDAFRMQIEWAKELKKPIVIHARDSFDEIFEIVDELNDDNLTGIFHCFTGDAEQAKKVIDYGGFYLGIGGVVTFKKSHLPELLDGISLEHIVLETDSPYLAPTPYRGKRNQSSYLKHVALKMADIKGVSLEEVANVTTANSQTIFGI